MPEQKEWSTEGCKSTGLDLGFLDGEELAVGAFATRVEEPLGILCMTLEEVTPSPTPVRYGIKLRPCFSSGSTLQNPHSPPELLNQSVGSGGAGAG